MIHDRRALISLLLPMFACGGDPSPAASSSDAAASSDGTAGPAGSSGGTDGVADTGASTGSTPADGSTGAPADDTGTVADVTGSFPAGLAVASPTASAMPMMPSLPANAQTVARTRDLVAPVHAQAGATLMPGKPYAVKQAELAEMISGADCGLVLGPIGGGYNPMCYGPWLDYQNHPDAAMGQPADGQLPGGDLGLWLATEPGGQACASVKLNALVDQVALEVDYGLYLAANLQCTMVVDGVSAPDPGVELDRTDAVHASLSASNPGLTVTRAVIARADDVDGRSVFRYDLELSFDAGGPEPVSMATVVVHRADLADATDYLGRVWSRFDHLPMGDGHAYSLGYAHDPSGLRYDLQAANIPTGAPDPFDADGAFDFASPFSGNATRATVALDPDTGSADMAFAWQAGPQDGTSRVFNVSVDYDSPDHGVGCGFFGFGPGFTAGGPADGTISTFICNWAGPGNQHTGELGWAQKQCMETDMTGMFVPTESHIAYAPVNDCDSSADPGFAYRDPTHMDFDTTPIVRDLVELASDPDYASWVPPVAP